MLPYISPFIATNDNQFRCGS